MLPDIVTMAKGIGNGMPLAAVVTTPEIAAVGLGIWLVGLAWGQGGFF